MREGLNHVRIVKADAPLGQRVNQLLIHAVGGAQMKFALLIIEHIDRASLGAGKLHRLGDDGGEHGLEIERRVHRLRHFSERAQLLDRAAKLIGALAQLVQQSRILDGDDGLRGEARNQRDLLLREGTDFLPGQRKRTDRFLLLQHRNSHVRPYTAEFDGRHIFRVDVRRSPALLRRRRRAIPSWSPSCDRSGCFGPGRNGANLRAPA